MRRWKKGERCERCRNVRKVSPFALLHYGWHPSWRVRLDPSLDLEHVDSSLHHSWLIFRGFRSATPSPGQILGGELIHLAGLTPATGRGGRRRRISRRPTCPLGFGCPGSQARSLRSPAFPESQAGSLRLCAVSSCWWLRGPELVIERRVPGHNSRMGGASRFERPIDACNLALGLENTPQRRVSLEPKG